MVDVQDEIKTESEINVSKEDGAYGGGNVDDSTTEAEVPVLQDTVEFVESTKTPVYDTQNKVQKKDSFGQLMYKSLKLDQYGTPMYAKILSEPAKDHVDANPKDEKCDRCGASMHVHKYGEELKTVVEAACTTEGKQAYVCACGVWDTARETVIPATGHVDADNDAICDKESCKASMSNHVHNYVETKTEPSCTAEGKTEYKCACGAVDAARTVTVPATGHVDANNDAICDKESCKAGVSNHVHNYAEARTEATCTAAGKVEYKCACGSVDDSRTSEIPMLSHQDENGDGTCDYGCGTGVSGGTGGEAPSGEQDGASGETPGGEQPTAARTNPGVGRGFGLQSRWEHLQFLATAVNAEKIVYDTASAPVYDTASEPVYEEPKVLSYKYTGWQTIDGKTYYYDKDGNRVTGTQVIQGVQYTFEDDGDRAGVIGIDVSKYQKAIDWNQVKNAGIDFVMVRCGYRGYGSGVLVEDSMFRAHVAGAKAAGLKVGLYYFSQAITEAEAVEEASMAVSLANSVGGITLPIAIDSEYAAGGAGRADGLNKADRTVITRAFCNTIANSGYTPMVYASKSWFSTHLDTSQLGGYRIWVAHYAAECGYTGRYDIWQYTSKGSVAGVSGNVDMNISYM